MKKKIKLTKDGQFPAGTIIWPNDQTIPSEVKQFVYRCLDAIRRGMEAGNKKRVN